MSGPPKGIPRTPGSGRKKGTPNKASAKREAAVAKSGKTPLQFLLDVMRDKKAPKAERIECAKAAAIYVHPKPATTVDVTGDLKLKVIQRVIVDPEDPDS